MTSKKYRAKLERRAVARGLDARAVKGASDEELRRSVKAVDADRKLFSRLRHPFGMPRNVRRMERRA